MQRPPRLVRAPRRGIGLLALALVSFLGARAHAQGVTGRVVMTTDRSEVPVGQPFRLQIRADVTGADVDNFEPPSLDGFDVQSRQISRPVQFRFGFGGQQQVVQSTTIHTYTLVPQRAGRFDLQPATVTAGAQTFQSSPITIVVGGGGTPPTSPTPANPTQPDPGVPQTNPLPGSRTIAVDGAQVDAQAFIRTVADNAAPYVGEQVTVSVYLYTRASIRSAPQVVREPTADGFWVHDLLPPQRTLDAQTQSIQGLTYRVYLIRRFAAFPLREGELTIGAPEMTLQTGSLFDILGNNGNQGQIHRTGVAVRLDARPLPNARPNAVVGEYTIENTIDRDQVRTGDAITMTAVVRGSGNVRDITFDLPAIDGLQILPPRYEDQIEQPADRVGGSRRAEWLIVPQRPGTYEIPALTLNAFNPENGTYREVQGPAIRFTAAGNAIAPVDDPAPDPAPEETPEATQDEPEAPTFGPMRNRSDLQRSVPPVSGQWWFLLLLIGMPVLAITGAFAVRQRRALAARPKTTNPKKRLAEAASKARAGETRAFYGTVAATLKQAVEAKLGEAVGGLTHDGLRQQLRQRGLHQDVVRRLIDELESCDFARFSSAGGSQQEMQQTLERAQALLNDLDGFRPQEAA